MSVSVAPTCPRPLQWVSRARTTSTRPSHRHRHRRRHLPRDAVTCTRSATVQSAHARARACPVAHRAATSRCCVPVPRPGAASRRRVLVLRLVATPCGVAASYHVPAKRSQSPRSIRATSRLSRLLVQPFVAPRQLPLSCTRAHAPSRHGSSTTHEMCACACLCAGHTGSSQVHAVHL